MFYRFAETSFRLQIPTKKGVVNDQGKKGHQQEALQGIGVMLHEMIGVPTVNQFIESVILNIPALVSQLDSTLDGNQVGWYLLTTLSEDQRFVESAD